MGRQDSPYRSLLASDDEDGSELSYRQPDYRSNPCQTVTRCLVLACVVTLIVGIIVTAIVLGLIVLVHEANAAGSTLDPGGDVPEPLGASGPRRSATEYYKHAAVATDNEVCSIIGRDMLKVKNASAVDAAIATMLCVGLHSPQSSGIGGGDVMLIYERPHGGTEKVLAVLDAREVAPLAATADMFEGYEGPEHGGLFMGVPGEIKGFYQAWKRFGRLPWSHLLEPTIRLCRNGFIVSDALAKKLQLLEQTIRDEPSLSELFVKRDGKLYTAGETMMRPKLADTLETIAQEGATVFYSGRIAKQVVQEIQGFGGIITDEDMSSYEVKWRDPYAGKLRHNGKTLVTAPLPYGGPIYKFILDLMQKYQTDVGSLTSTEDHVLFYHRMIESFKFAYAMRTRLGDPDFSNLTKALDGLRSKNLLDYIHSKIDDNTTHNIMYYGPKSRPAPEGGTVHVSILAPDGAAVSATSSVNGFFGACRRGQHTGIIYNNEMGDFAKPSDEIAEGRLVPTVNLIEPKKRALSSECPVIVFDEKRNVAEIIGGAGGSLITETVAYASLLSLLKGESIDAAIDAPRLYHKLIPNTLEWEAEFPEAILEGLERKGHATEMAGSEETNLHAVKVDCHHSDVPGSCIAASSDWRKGGAPSGF